MRHKVKWWCSLSLVQHRTTVVFILFSLFPTLLGVYTQEHDINMPHQEVEFWARKIGNHIFHLSNAFALYNDIKDNFHSRDATLQENDGLQLVKEMASDVTNMMKFKVDAVNRIMNVAEEASLDKYKQDEAVDYFNAKRLNPSPDIPQEAIDDKNYRNLSLLSNSHFDGIPINESVSSVHVPTNVYAKAPDVINAIRWSGRLDRTFKSNYELDPTLSWQYFGSSTGFLRQYPASEWVMDEKDPDLYDARLRSWYIQAASSPKDMVILLDVSGSMTGLRKEIAIHVVLNILETLNENDFVNIFNFSTETTELVSCFNDSLVQANMENIGEFKKALKTIETKEIANFSKALIKAFELLQRTNSQYNKSGQGSQCNQAIMVVTDGAPDNYEKIFSTYNWPHFQVRVFTYLIGREEKKKRDLSWMACANKGYFVQVTTLAEVREQVLRYIPVMARPMVMYQEDHHHIWTGVYADIADPKQIEWLWEVREGKRQRDRTENYQKLQKLVKDSSSLTNIHALQDKWQVENFLRYGEFGLSSRSIARIKAAKMRKMRRQRLRRRDIQNFTLKPEVREKIKHEIEIMLKRRVKRDVLVLIPNRIHDYDLWKHHKRLLREQEKLEKWYEDIRMGRRGAPGLKEGYRLMTSVAVPVFDRKKTSNITERVLVNESVWVLRKRETKTANLLGVAGTDVPIREIEKLVPPYKLGVNGYSFMVNSNGYVIYHPDLRPVHRESNAEFQDILKPNYNSVDFAEVELTDYENEARANDSELLEMAGWRDYYSKLRKELVEQNPAERMMNVKIHLDDMKRVVQRTQKYFAQKISGTPFSLGIAMPDGYGKYKVHGQIELTREIQDRRAGDVMDHFSTGNWSLHPDWVYCEYKYDQHQEDQSPEALIKEFLSRAQKPNWKWRSTRTRPPPDPIMNQAQHKRWKPSMGSDERKDNYYCDKDLVQSLLFDARATNVYSREVKIEDKIKDKNPVAIYIMLLSMGSQNFGITTAFVATRSGLTRWIDNPSESSSSNGNSKERHFMKVHNRAIDEVWYKRAVDYYKEDQDAYVYSVPFDAATRDPDEVLVTATRAIFVEENEYRMAPAAVVGVTIKHRKFVDFFKNETYKCPSYPSRDSSCKKAKTCESTSLNCYLLDDNGFIIASENEDDTGKFFGTLEGTIMESLVQSEVYKKIQVFDYQAVCLDTQEKNSMASILTTPIQTLKWFANWMMGNVFWVLVKTQLYTLWDPNEAWAYAQGQWDPNAAPTDEVTYSKGPINHQSTFGEYQEMFPDEAVITEESSGEGSGKYPEEDGSGREGSGEEEIALYEGILEYEVQDYLDGIPTEDTKRTESPDVVGDFPPLEKLKKKGYPIQLAYINKTHPRPCDKTVYLYKLQSKKLKQDGLYKPVKGKLSNCHTNGCGRPFSVQKVISTNLILVAVNSLCPCESRKVDIEPVEVEHNETTSCNRLLMQHYRKRPQSCVNYHPDEHEIKLCGGAGSLGPSSVALLTLLLAHIYNSMMQS
ncbi:voltage-dependent calcium channel subunit alpha-2/delta-3-like isoform X4 [Portunus trituberculatus]|uniref:voltage-dependent calcium channel subunit alpha-2/delta-3-like isoform X4 n=1 Tax=Portunus trituberculatus TaxID=210409 RepID=UPI001E1CB2EC|nr:voltage-dependent calcium channel subunit alpha-2/delta-3-like isoform X4 [Portunus trituberculatus]